MEEIFSKILTKIIEQTVNFAPLGGVSLVVFIFFWISGSIARKIVRHLGEKFGEEREAVFRLVGSTLKVGLVLFGFITALGTMGVDISALIAGLGLSGFALGFALKDALSNLLAGIMIIMYRPFNTNDRILVAGCEGEVSEINLRYTVLDGVDRKFVIPNNTIFANTINILNKASRR